MRAVLLLLLILTSCSEPLSEEGKTLRTKQAQWWAEVHHGASAGCIHPLKDNKYSKCQAIIVRDSVVEFYSLLCYSDDCITPELVKCEQSK